MGCAGLGREIEGILQYVPRSECIRHPLGEGEKVWVHQDSNLGPPDYESGALTN